MYNCISQKTIGNRFIPFRVVRALFWALRISQELFLNLFRVFFSEPLAKSFCKYVGDDVRIERVPYVSGLGDVILNDNVLISGKINIGFNQKVHSKRELIVGKSSFVGHNCSFGIAKSITIGEYCYISGGVRIADNDGHPLDYTERRLKMPVHKSDVKPVVIGNDVWIGRNAMVLKGVTIGDRVVVGACSVVTKSIPSDSIIVGNPAKVIRGKNVC